MTLVDAAALQAQIALLPPLADDPAYLVFADWLQSQGHPWGELVVLQHRLAKAAPEERDTLEGAVAQLLEHHGEDIIGGLPRDADTLDWHLGFVRRAQLVTPAQAEPILAATEALLGAPAARMLEALALAPRVERLDTTRDWGNSAGNIVDPWPDWDELGKLLHERVPRLAFGEGPRPRAAAAYVRMPSFDMISRWLRTTLRSLELTGSAPGVRAPLELLHATELAVRYAEAGDEDLAALAASKLPVLERLSVALGGSAHCILDDVYAPEEYDSDNEDQERYPSHYFAGDLEALEVHEVSSNVGPEALRRFLDAVPPGVTDLGLPSSALNQGLLEVVVAHPRLATLRRLDLSACGLRDLEAEVLRGASGPLGRLASIDLSRNRLSAEGAAHLARVLPNAALAEQGSEDPDFFMRYVATME